MQLPYCSQYTGSHPSASQYPCQYLDALDISTASERSFAVITRISRREEVRTLSVTACCAQSRQPLARTAQRRVCGYDDHVQHCKFLFNDTADHTTFVANIEDYTMMVDHTVQAPSLGVSGAREALLLHVGVPCVLTMCMRFPGSARLLHGRIHVPNADSVCANATGAAQHAVRPVGLAVLSAAAFADTNSRTAPCVISPNVTRTNLDLFRIGYDCVWLGKLPHRLTLPAQHRNGHCGHEHGPPEGLELQNASF